MWISQSIPLSQDAMEIMESTRLWQHLDIFRWWESQLLMNQYYSWWFPMTYRSLSIRIYQYYDSQATACQICIQIQMTRHICWDLHNYFMFGTCTALSIFLETGNQQMMNQIMKVGSPGVFTFSWEIPEIMSVFWGCLMAMENHLSQDLRWNLAIQGFSRFLTCNAQHIPTPLVSLIHNLSASQNVSSPFAPLASSKICLICGSKPISCQRTKYSGETGGGLGLWMKLIAPVCRTGLTSHLDMIRQYNTQM